MAAWHRWGILPIRCVRFGQKAAKTSAITSRTGLETDDDAQPLPACIPILSKDLQTYTDHVRSLRACRALHGISVLWEWRGDFARAERTCVLLDCPTARADGWLTTGHAEGAVPSFAVSGKLIATCLALTGFAVAIVAGLAAGNPATLILRHSILAMLVCYVAGMLVGMIARVATAAQIESQPPAQSTQPAHPAESTVHNHPSQPQPTALSRAA